MIEFIIDLIFNLLSISIQRTHTYWEIGHKRLLKASLEVNLAFQKGDLQSPCICPSAHDECLKHRKMEIHLRSPAAMCPFLPLKRIVSDYFNNRTLTYSTENFFSRFLVPSYRGSTSRFWLWCLVFGPSRNKFQTAQAG